MSFGFKGLNLNSFNQLIFVMVKYGVLFEVRTGFLNIIYTSFGFKGLNGDYFLNQHQQIDICNGEVWCSL
jgi:hypothetical protein